MNKLKVFIISFFFLIYHNYSIAISVHIKAKVQNEIITNIDIEHEKRYLIFLNPSLDQLISEKADEIAKNSLITEIIKRTELEKFYNLEEANNITNIVEDNFLKKKKIKNKKEFLEILESRNLDYKKIRSKLQIEGLWNRFIYKKYSKNIKINKVDLRQEIVNKFKSTKKKFEYKLSEIVFEEAVNENLKNKINEINKSIIDIGFENSANIYSISSTSKNGGLIGWVNELQISKIINQNIENIKIGDVSAPIKIPSGYLLIKVNDKKEYKQKINLEKQLERLISQERNRQLNSFSIIFYKKLKMNLDINEY